MQKVCPNESKWKYTEVYQAAAIFGDKNVQWGSGGRWHHFLSLQCFGKITLQSWFILASAS